MSERRYTRKYSMEWYITDWRHTWEIVGARGGAHLGIHPYTLKDMPEEYSAGLEMHYAAPPAHRRDQAPDHLPCWLLKIPCWHDGTSLYAQEHFVPMFLHKDHDGIFAEMIRWCDGNLREDS